MTEKKEFKLPEEVSVPSNPNSRDLVIISIPKMGKGTILGSFTTNHNALILDLEKGGYEYIPARKMSVYEEDTTIIEAYRNYLKVRDLLLTNKGKYEYLIIDGLSDLDSFSEIGGTFAYMNSVIGQRFNRKDGKKLEFDDPDFKIVTSLPDGAGYKWTREWFLSQIETFRQISPYRIYAAHVVDKLIKDNLREEVVGSEISLTGKLKTIFASKVTSLAKLTSDGNKRYLNFEVLNDNIIAGSRNPKLEGKILISDVVDGKITTYWDSIYK